MVPTGSRTRRELLGTEAEPARELLLCNPARGQVSVHAHREKGPSEVPTAVVTVSDTRSLDTDSGGDLVERYLSEAGHPVTRREIVPDEGEAIRRAVLSALAESPTRAVIATGGTGVAPRDVTPEAVAPLLDREIPGFGELFRMLSYEEIGSAALLSRATAGIRAGQVVFVLPGSRGAIRLAMEKLILPELAHLAGEATKTT